MDMLSPKSLFDQVVEFVREVPLGNVVSYGQIAAKFGVNDPRTIGNVMHSTGGLKDFPWWRVVNNEGKITIKDPAARLRQKELLVGEGVRVNDDFVLDIEKYRY